MKILRIHTLKRGWCDKDEVMLHAAFQLLIDFVEQEKPDKVADWTHDALHRNAWKEMQALYKWWTRTRPARKDPLDDKRLKRPPMRFKKIPDSEDFEMVPYDKTKYAAYERAARKSCQLDKKWEEEDQQNLLRLVNIRGFLWC